MMFFNLTFQKKVADTTPQIETRCKSLTIFFNLTFQKQVADTTPQMETMKKKYEAAMKEKMMSQIEREKVRHVLSFFTSTLFF